MGKPEVSGFGKTALILSGNRKKAPYISFYKKYIADLDIISWDRLSIEESSPLTFKREATEWKTSRLKNFMGYVSYRKFVLQRLKDGEYDRVIVCNLMLMVVLFDLRRKLIAPLSYDVRDYSIAYKLFKGFFKKIFQKAEYVFISSEGFRQWLPEEVPYKLIHNFDFDSPQCFKHKKIESPINVIVFGSIRDYEANKHLIDQLANRSEFEVNFHGSGPLESALKEYTVVSNISNVTFHGFYEPHQEGQFLSNADIIYNFTELDTNSKTLITNRYYRAVCNFIPQIVRKTTHQGDLIQQNKVGISVDLAHDLAKSILDNLSYFNSQEFADNCKKAQNMIKQDIQSYNSLFV